MPTDVANMKVADLKRELKVRGLNITGNKNELQERLQAAMEGEPLLEDSSITGEDILDEDAVLSDEEKILGADENELLKSPTTTRTSILTKTVNEESKAVSEDEILESPTTVSKKVVLKRKSSTTNIVAAPDNTNTTSTTTTETIGTKENTEPLPAKTLKMSERNPITIGDSTKPDEGEKAAAAATANKKLSELTLQERLELRAKKFGISIPSNATTDNKKSETIGAAPVVNDEKQVELLKKRAERFGCVTSTNLVKLDTEEKLLKRKERFGGADSTTSTGSNKSNDWDEKARKRLERFNANTSPNPATITPPASAAST